MRVLSRVKLFGPDSTTRLWHPLTVFNMQRPWQQKPIELWLSSIGGGYGETQPRGSFPPSTAPANQSNGQGARASSKAKQRILRVSSVAEVVIFGESAVRDNREKVAKDRNMELARFTLGTAGSGGSELFQAVWCFKTMWCWTVVRQIQLVVSKQCRSLLMF